MQLSNKKFKFYLCVHYNISKNISKKNLFTLNCYKFHLKYYLNNK